MRLVCRSSMGKNDSLSSRCVLFLILVTPAVFHPRSHVMLHIALEHHAVARCGMLSYTASSYLSLFWQNYEPLHRGSTAYCNKTQNLRYTN